MTILRKCISLFAIWITLSAKLSAQDIKFAGTDPPDTTVLNLLGRYEEATRNIKRPGSKTSYKIRGLPSSSPHFGIAPHSSVHHL
jgi:hypothetical protein